MNYSKLFPLTRTSKAASSEHFKVMLHRERALADRNGREFSLLIYHTQKDPPHDVDKLIRILAKRIRETDEIGWLDPHELGVLLRQSNYEGAHKLAQSLTGLIADQSQPFAWSILCYPDKQPDQAQGDFPNISKTEPPNSQLLALMTRPVPVWKRLTDIVFSAIGLLCLSPILALISIGIMIVSPGPILFKQERIGYLGRRFMCLKFRSMKMHAPTNIHRDYLQQLIHSEAPMEKLDGSKDNRIIPMGRLLRACALDELPQLFNVLRGDMSLVGPRPCLAYEFETYLRWHKRRFDTLPGLTGLWQVSGKNKTSFREMMRLDIVYEQRRSFLFDLMIISKTPLVIGGQLFEAVNPFSKEHIYESAH